MFKADGQSQNCQNMSISITYKISPASLTNIPTCLAGTHTNSSFALHIHFPVFFRFPLSYIIPAWFSIYNYSIIVVYSSTSE